MDQENELLELSGTVENIIYKNEENGYTVLRLKNDSGELVFAGTPEDCAQCEASFTGQFLKPLLG